MKDLIKTTRPARFFIAGVAALAFALCLALLFGLAGETTPAALPVGMLSAYAGFSAIYPELSELFTKGK